MPLILSWVLMGNVYPVIESPDDKTYSLLGAPVQKGYDSHYVLVKKVVEHCVENYLPCKHTDPSGPDYDELVLFNPDQILPRYLCYYKSEEETGMLHDKWVYWIGDPDRSVQVVSEANLKDIKVKFFASTIAFQQFLDENQSTILFMNDFPRVICNYYQPGTKEVVGERFCLWLKNSRNIWKWIPFALYCEDYGAKNATITQSKKMGIWVSEKIAELIVFASSATLPDKFV